MSDKTRYFQNAGDGDVWSEKGERARKFAARDHLTEVQVVPLDAIVIRRDELPKVTTGSGRLQSGVWAEGRGWDDAYIASAGRGALATRAEAIARKYLAVAEHLRAHPPVDAEQVARISKLIVAADREDINYLDADDVAKIAYRLVERGVRVEKS